MTIRLGVETDTDDAEGAVTATCDAAASAAVTAAVVGDALAQFRGRSSRRPPPTAALKRDGRPLYAYARAGEPVEVAAARRRRPRARADPLRRARGRPAARPLLQGDVRPRAGARPRPGARRGRATSRRCAGHGRVRSRSLQARPLPEILEALVRSSRGSGAADASAGSCSSPSRRAARICPSTGSTKRRPGTFGLASASPGSWRLAARRSRRVCLLDPAGDLIAVAEPRPDGLVKTLRVFGASQLAKNDHKTNQQTAEKPS